MPQVTTSCEDLNRVLRAEGGRLRTDTVARLTSLNATGIELSSRRAQVADRTSRLPRCDDLAEDPLTLLAAVHARVASEVSIGKVVQ